MEVTKWLKPSISVSRIGDSASVQAATRVNAEQSSKRTMRRSTRQPFPFLPACIFAIGIEHPLGMTVQRFHPAARPDP